MKNILLVISLLFVISCNYDLKYYRDIVGEWQCFEITQNNISNPCGLDKFQFLQDRSYVRQQDKNQSKGMYKIDGNKLHYQVIGSPVNSYRIKSIEGDTMRLESLDNKDDFDISFVRMGGN